MTGRFSDHQFGDRQFSDGTFRRWDVSATKKLRTMSTITCVAYKSVAHRRKSVYVYVCVYFYVCVSVCGCVGILSAWRFVLGHFVCISFCPGVFCLHGVLSWGILSTFRFVLLHFVCIAFCPVAFCLHCVMSWGILPELRWGIFSCGILSKVGIFMPQTGIPMSHFYGL